ncbi:MAG: DNA primase [Alphaproteobacteria bacterium]|nr:DNA primase [Alphaproteobacteria bacterium]
MRFSDSFLDDIRQRLPITSVVGEHVSWDKRKSQPGRGDMWACCPFHGEKTPSFHADDRRGIYHCFGCGVTGDHFRFLTEKAGMSFPEAVEVLAAKAGLDLPARDPRQEASDRVRQSLYDVMDLAQRYFEAALAANIGARTRGYLRERGVEPPVAEQFGLGFAPNARVGLKEFLAQNGVGAEAMAACGLVVAGEDIAVPYDRFRNRLMFPIRNFRGRIVAFGGRAMSEDMAAKYLNSPETELFSKRRTLYNAQGARQAAHDGKPLIVVEGYMDVIALVSAGVTGAVAPLGTALTEEHIGMLWRMSPNPVIAFDGDGAGQRAAGRTIDLIVPRLKPGYSISLLNLPEGQDPDDVIRELGAPRFLELVARATPLAEALWDRLIRGGGFDTPEARAGLEADLKAVAGQIGDPAVRRHYTQAFDERLAVFFRPLEQKSFARGGRSHDGRGHDGRSYGARHGFGDDRRWRPGGRAGPARVLVSEGLKKSRLFGAGSAPSPREAVIVLAVVNHPELAEERHEDLAGLELTSPAATRLLGSVLDMISAAPESTAQTLRETLERAGLGEDLAAIDTVVRRQGVWQAGPDANKIDAETGLKHALALHYKSVRLNRELKAAELALGNEPSEESYERLRDIQNQISSVEGTEALIEGFGSLSGRSVRDL